MNKLNSILNQFVIEAAKAPALTEEQVLLARKAYIYCATQSRNFKEENLPPRIKNVWNNLKGIYEIRENLKHSLFLNTDVYADPFIEGNISIPKKGNIYSQDRRSMTIYKYLDSYQDKIFQTLSDENFKTASDIEWVNYKDTERATTSRKKQHPVTKIGFMHEVLHTVGSLWLKDIKGLLNSDISEDEDNFNTYLKEEISEQYDECEDFPGSCMTKDIEDGKFGGLVELYSINPDSVKLIRYKSVRFLMWRTDDGSTVIDRIYQNGDKLIPIIHDWAERKGYLYRKDCHDHADSRLNDGSTKFVTLYIEDLYALPYMDTFKYGKPIGTTKLLLSNRYRDDLTMRLERTDGDYINSITGAVENLKTKYCKDCFKAMSIDDKPSNIYEHNGEFYCENCYTDKFTSCDQCNKTFLSDVINYFEDETGNSHSYDGYYCNECYDDNITKCKDCDLPVHNQMIYHTDDGIPYCEDCYKLLEKE